MECVAGFGHGYSLIPSWRMPRRTGLVQHVFWYQAWKESVSQMQWNIQF